MTTKKNTFSTINFSTDSVDDMLQWLEKIQALKAAGLGHSIDEIERMVLDFSSDSQSPLEAASAYLLSLTDDTPNQSKPL